MNNQEKYDKDLLSRYINPEKIEKAPEGFTSKVMATIQMENETVMFSMRKRKRNLVPVISGLVTLLLIASVFIIPGNEDEKTAFPALELLKNIKISLPEIDLTSLFSFNVPATVVYGLLGILILSLLDRAILRFFHREL
jgi:hypothetical protein